MEKIPKLQDRVEQCVTPILTNEGGDRLRLIRMMMKLDQFELGAMLGLSQQQVSALEASGANPRRKFDRKAIEGLAASIRNDGLLHNLVVKYVSGKRDETQN